MARTKTQEVIKVLDDTAANLRKQLVKKSVYVNNVPFPAEAVLHTLEPVYVTTETAVSPMLPPRAVIQPPSETQVQAPMHACGGCGYVHKSLGDCPRCTALARCSPSAR